MNQSLLLSDELHLLKSRNFEKLQSKLKNTPLTDMKKTQLAQEVLLLLQQVMLF